MNWTRASTIGRGSTATVSLATTASGELFAAKSAELSLSGPLQKEQTILSKLDSPYVVKYKGFDITEENDDNKLFYTLFMEYHPRGTLSDEIRRLGGKIEEPMVRLYTWQILRGLEYLHSNGIVHCDIKSSNILMGNENVKISDLGCSKVLGDDNRLVICGTPMFMPPEVVLGQGQGFEADIWSLGCTVIEMATGKNPWPQVHDPVSALYRIGFSGESPEIPGWLSQEGKDFLGKCLKRNPRERLTAKDLLKHPFFDGLSSLGFEKERVDKLEVSPRSVFDQSAWDSFEALTQASYVDYSDHVAERIERLIIIDDHQDMSLVSSSGWTLDDEDWITVRSNSEISDAVNYFSNESLSLGVHVNNTIVSPVISGIRKRCFTIAFDECVECDHVPRNLRFKKRNENFRSFQYLLILIPL